MPPFWVGFSKQRKKPGSRRSSIAFKTRFFNFPHRGETKKHPWDRILQFRFHATILGGFFKAAEEAGCTKVVNCVQNAFFQLSPSGRNEKTPLGSNFTISVSCHHFGWVFQSSGRSRVYEGRPIAFKTRFFNFPHRGETKKHPWDPILQFRFHATILGGLFQAAEKAGFTKVVPLRSKRVFSTFPIGAKRKNTLGIEFYNFGFMPPFWVGFSKQRKKPGVRRSSNCVQNAFFQLSPSGRNEKTPLGSNFTISVSCHHFGWAFPSSGKSRVHEGRQLRSKRVFSTFPIGAKRKNTLGIEFYNFGFMPPFWVGFSKQRKKPGVRRSSIAFKTRFFNFPHRGETKKHPWDRILQFRFHATILGGFFKAAEEAGCTKVVQLRSKRVFSTFPIGAKRKNTLGIEFYNFGFMPPFWVGFSKQRKKPGSRRSSHCVQNAFFQLSPSGRNEKTPLGSNFTISVSCHHFGWVFQSSGRSRVYEGRPIAFKTRFFNFPHRGETKKHPWDRILQFRFHATILGGLFQAAEKAGFTKVVPLRSKRIFQLSPSGRNEKTPLGSNFTISVSCHHFGWVFRSSGRSRVYEGRPIAFKTRFFNFPHRGETKKHPWDRILQFRFHATILGGLFQAAEKAGLTKVVQLRSKRVFSTYPIGEKRKNTLGIEFYNFGLLPPFWVGFSKQRKKPGSRRSSNCFQNAFFQLSPSGRNEKTPLGSNFTISVSCHHFGWAFPSSGKSRVHEGRPIAFKTHFSTFPIGAKRKNTLGIEFYNFGFMPPFWVGFSKQRKKPGVRRSSNCVQNAFFQLSPSGRNEKTPLGSNFTISVSCHHFGWAFPSSGKSRVHEGRPIAFKTRFFNFPHRGETKKHPWDQILQFRFHATILGGFFKAAEEAGCTKVVQLRSKRVFSTFPIGAKRKNTLGIEFYNFGFMPPFWVGFSKQRKKPGSRRSSHCVQNAFFNFPHRGETKKHPWDRILQFRFHATILGGFFEAAEEAGCTKVVQLRSKRVFSTFPIGAKRKNTLGIEFYNFGFMPPFWVGFSKQRKKPGSRRSSHCVQNAFFQLSPSGRNEKTPLGSNFTISVSCHHFGWAFPSSGKSRVDEGRPIAFETQLDSGKSSSGKSRVHEGRRIAF